ncbi:polysaccharide deacetylase family protein [Luteolibacter yonseiensis]|uniref:Polysaccharide deacetylase family protein n=1 Tax=Luteolibacter yonseiensis TaxID=1144680 RepID=A0A934VD18_9BACT|nr:polysaccharide deacetylase family protein [Luteolibacter yonseiensis]MBK1817566.1 polysaccharide deacetylase family protein [Luteolibacter yonseiensis]
MRPPSDNRAVSSLFRVFGAGEPRVAGDVEERASRQGMHRHETAVFAVLFPLTIWVATSGPLAAMAGPFLGCLLAVPVTLLVMQLLPFILAVRSQPDQWRLWLTVCLLWAVMQCGAGGWAGMFAYFWIALAVLEIAADGVLFWRECMRWSGAPGIAWRVGLFVIPHGMVMVAAFKWGWPWFFAGGGLLAAMFCSWILSPYSQVLGPVIRSTDGERILITIDDGPDPHDTPLLLDLLDRHDTKAIFFMIGEKVLAHPDLAREVVRRGHEIGNHTLTHPQARFWCAGPSRTRREIEECQKIIRGVTGNAPRYFRAPVGHRNLFTHPVANELGLAVMSWNRRGFDAVEKDPGKVLSRILPDLAKGDIVLLHEATPIAVEVLNGVLDRIPHACGKAPAG